MPKPRKSTGHRAEEVRMSRSKKAPSGKSDSGTKPLHLSRRSVFFWYKHSASFRARIGTGKYVLLDGYLVLREFAYYLKEHGIALSDALQGKVDIPAVGDADIGKCYCLNIVTEDSSSSTRKTFSGKSIRHHATAGHVFSSRYRRRQREFEHASLAYSSSKTIKQKHDAFLASVTGGTGSGGDDDPTFSELLQHHMSNNNLTDEALSELTGISDRAIRGMRNNSDRRPLLKNVVAICIALHLFPSQSMKLLKAAGYTLRPTETEATYGFLLDCAYDCDVIACNDFLIGEQMEPLTDLHSDYELKPPV